MFGARDHCSLLVITASLSACSVCSPSIGISLVNSNLSDSNKSLILILPYLTPSCAKNSATAGDKLQSKSLVGRRPSMQGGQCEFNWQDGSYANQRFVRTIDTFQVRCSVPVSLSVTSYSIAHTLCARHPAADPDRVPDRQCGCLGRSSGSAQVG